MAWQTLTIRTSTTPVTWDEWDDTAYTDGVEFDNSTGRVVVLIRMNHDADQLVAHLYLGGELTSNVPGDSPNIKANASMPDRPFKSIRGVTKDATIIGPLNPTIYNDASNNVRLEPREPLALVSAILLGGN